MLPGPVFNFELLTTARRPRYYVIRLAYGLILLFFIWQNYENSAWRRLNANGEQLRLTIQEMASLGHSLFATYMITQIVAVLLLTPALVAGVIADEKQRKTLHYLLASPLTSGEIVLGKLLARSIHLGVFVAVGLPIISLLTLFGGVDPKLVLLGFAGTFTMAYFVAGLSIFISTISKRPREAISLSYVLVLCWLFLPFLVSLIMPQGGPISLLIYEWIKPVNDWIAATSPITALATASRMAGGGTAAAMNFLAWMMGLQLAYGSVLIVLAMWQLRPAYRRGDSSPRWVTRLASLRRGRRFLPRPECGDDPMLWKERYVSRTNPVTKIVAIVVMLGIVGLLGYTTYEWGWDAFIEVSTYGYGKGTNRGRSEFNGYLRLICTVLYCVLYLGTASAAAGLMAREREEDTWISLISTPLDGVEIVRAKMIGAFWGLRWIAGLMVGFWLIGLAAGSIHPLGLMAIAIETPVFLWFATALGTYFSLRARSSSRALTGTIGLLIILNGGYMMCCAWFQNHSMVVAAGITPMVTAISLISYEDLNRAFNTPDEPVPTCIISVILYAIGAIVLTIAAFGRFDVEADRPRRSYGPPWDVPIKYLDPADQNELA